MQRLLLLVALGALAAETRGGPTPKSIDRWKDPANVARLERAWLDAPPEKGPFLLYVHAIATRASARAEKQVFANTAIVLAARACPWVRITPDKAADLPYLKAIARISDPMLVVVGPGGRVHGILDDPRKFTARHCFELLAKAADEVYEVPLAKYVDAYVKILEATERLAKDEKRRAALEHKGKQEEAKKLQAEIAAAREDLADREKTLRASLRAGAESGEAPAGDDAVLRSLERDVVRAYRNQSRVKDPYRRAIAVDGLGAIDTPEMVQRILEAVRTGDSWTSWRAGKTLGRMRSKASLARIVKALAKGTPRERRAALLSFAERGHAPAAAFILTFARSRTLAMRLPAVRALGGQSDGETAAALVAAIEDDHPAIRALAARGVGRRGLARNAAAVHELLDDEDWCVRKAAVEALGMLRLKDSVPHLLFRFQKERGLLRETCHDALVEITAQTFCHDLDTWNQWWAGARESFEPPTRKLVEHARARLGKPEPEDVWTFACKHHGIRSSSRRVVFLIDVGPGMELQMDLPEGASAEKRKELRSGSKLELVKRELVRTLKALDRDDLFNIMVYAGGVRTWRQQLVRAAHRPAAIQFIEKIKTLRAGKRTASSVGTGSGRESAPGTALMPTRLRSGLIAPVGHEHERNVYDALLTAFGILDAQPLRDAGRPEADTVFLVADGTPSFGQVREVKRLAEIVRELNRTRGVVVHVICFDEPTRLAYESLAQATGGEHVLCGN